MKQGVHRFLRVPLAQLAVVKELLAKIADPPESAKDMFTAEYSATGLAPATHYISSGLIDKEFADILGSAALTFAIYQYKGGNALTLLQVQAMYAAVDIRTDAQGYEQTVLDLLGMKPVATVL